MSVSEGFLPQLREEIARLPLSRQQIESIIRIVSGLIDRIADAHVEERRLNQARFEALGKVRHELRTPLIAMQQALALLADEVVGPLSEEQKKFALLAQQNLERLNALIDKLEISAPSGMKG